MSPSWERQQREDEQEGAQTEREHGALDVPLEADEPEVELSHPGAERGEDDFA